MDAWQRQECHGGAFDRASQIRQEESSGCVHTTKHQGERRDECIKSILIFSPRDGKGTNSDVDKSALREAFEPKLLVKDFCTFRQLYTQFQGKDMSQICLIIDESHELFNDRLKNRAEIYQLISRAQRVFLLSGDHSPRM